eukprot:7455929-Heterocapsa_arctica.AAC.1
MRERARAGTGAPARDQGRGPGGAPRRAPGPGPTLRAHAKPKHEGHAHKPACFCIAREKRKACRAGTPAKRKRATRAAASRQAAPART